MNLYEFYNLPDVRDAPTAMLYGRVVEYVNMSENELQLILQRLLNCN